MTFLNPTIKNLRALVVGQMRTSRTEDLSRYLSGQVVTLTVISFRTPLTSDPCIKIETYADAITVEPKSQILWQRQRRHSGPLSRIEPLLIFITYGLRILAYLRSCRNEHDMVIGIATFSALICMIARRLGWQNYTLIYYCLDYYLQPASGVANRVIFKCYKLAERLLITNADAIWDISPRIKNAREQFDRIPISSYQAHTVPLGYFDIRAGDPVAAKNRTLNAVGF
ncbi:MAG: hypothetical protein VYE62_08220, partial [Pseudomonadota bacterium]|nr:hypothetical protein [Pseudomonadota bacterium]